MTWAAVLALTGLTSVVASLIVLFIREHQGRLTEDQVTIGVALGTVAALMFAIALAASFA